MTLPSFFDLAKIGELAIFVLMIVQYGKQWIPITTPPVAMKVLTMLVGIAASILAVSYATGAVANWVQAIANGIMAAIMADGGYQFFSPKASQSLSFPSLAEIGNVKKSLP